MTRKQINGKRRGKTSEKKVNKSLFFKTVAPLAVATALVVAPACGNKDVGQTVQKESKCKAQVQELQSKVEDLESKVSDLEKQGEENKKEAEGLESKVETLESKVKKFEEKPVKKKKKPKEPERESKGW